MFKEDRFCIEEIYIVGFVFLYDFLDVRFNSIDLFLELLVWDLEEGFIEGIKKVLLYCIVIILY